MKRPFPDTHLKEYPKMFAICLIATLPEYDNEKKPPLDEA
jgi:hypothetical protein